MGESTKLNSLETFRLFLFLLSRPHCLRKSPFAPLSNSYTLKMSGESMDTDQKTYGGCEGPDAMYVKLISSDGHEFIVKRDHALTSGTIKAMLSGPGQFAENETNEVNFREIPSHVFHLQGEIHQQFNGDPRIPNSARNRFGTSYGRKLFGLLKSNSIY